MITLKESTLTEQSQLDRKELAVGAWREGRPKDGLLILQSITREEMSPLVAGEVFTAEAALLCALPDFQAALGSLEKAAPFIDFCNARTRGAFYFHRGLIHRNLGNTDAALTDYAGCIIYWQEAGESNYEIAAYINLAELYLRKENFSEAGQYIDRAFGLLTNDSTHLCNAYDTRARILAAEGHLVAAWADASTAVERARDNEIWLADCERTRNAIKEQLVNFMVPIVTITDLKRLKIDVIRHALDVNDGDPLRAARMINTSRQVIEYAAAEKGLNRKPARRTSIIKKGCV